MNGAGLDFFLAFLDKLGSGAATAFILGILYATWRFRELKKAKKAGGNGLVCGFDQPSRDCLLGIRAVLDNQAKQGDEIRQMLNRILDRLPSGPRGRGGGGGGG